MWIDRPPCWPEGRTCPNSCAERLLTEHTTGNVDLQGEWNGWRVRRDVLVSPAGKRIRLAQLERLVDLHGFTTRTRARALGDQASDVGDRAASHTPIEANGFRRGCRECADARVESLFLVLEPEVADDQAAVGPVAPSGSDRDQSLTEPRVWAQPTVTAVARSGGVDSVQRVPCPTPPPHGPLRAPLTGFPLLP